jgi:hypothetical protein
MHAGEVAELPPDLNAKPVLVSVIRACVRKWAAENATQIGPWAYDGAKNLYARKPVASSRDISRDGYQGFYVELPPEPGSRHPGRYMCAFVSFQT